MKKIFWGVAALVMALVVIAISYGAYLNLAGESNIAARMASPSESARRPGARAGDARACRFGHGELVFQ